MKLHEITEDIQGINDTQHAIERVKVAANLCSKLGNDPIIYRAMKGLGTFYGGKKYNLIHKINRVRGEISSPHLTLSYIPYISF